LKHRVALVIALLVVVLTGDAHAHASRTSYLDITEIAAGEAIASLRNGGGAKLAITSPDCSIDEVKGALHSQSVTMAHLRCARGLAGATIAVTGMVDGSDVVIARVALEHGDARGSVLTARSPRLVVPSSSHTDGGALFAHYVCLGVEHVLSGLDHVLFLLALVWQAHAASKGALRSWALELARAATVFTVAHTASLTATTLGWLHVPSHLAEAMIAVSLVLVALDIGRENSSRLGVVLMFGLVHGLGFAGALADARLPENAAALGLFGFNIGVELGQVMLLAIAVLLIALLAKPVLRVRAATLSAYAIGATGAYLFLARSILLFR
jgi:hypothetical protein